MYQHLTTRSSQILDSNIRAHLTPYPALEAGSINTVHHGDVVKMDVLDVGGLSLVGAQRADAHAVGLVADGAALEEDVLGPRSDGDGVVAVVDDAVADGYVGAADVEAVRVKGEGGRVRGGFDDGVLDGDVAALDGKVPGDGLQGLEVLDVAWSR